MNWRPCHLRAKHGPNPDPSRCPSFWSQRDSACVHSPEPLHRTTSPIHSEQSIKCGLGQNPVVVFFCLLFYLSPKALDIVIFHITNNCMHVDMPSTKIDTTSSIFTRAWNAFNIMSPLKNWHLHIPDTQMVIIIHKASRNPWNWEGWPWPSHL